VIVSLLIVFATLAGCEVEREWTHEGALAPTLKHMDADGDGVVVEAEYVPLVLAGPSFDRVDLNRDGTLDAVELERLVYEQDPISFDGVGGREGWGETQQSETTHPDSFERRSVRDLLRSLTEAIRAVAPEAELPDEAMIAQAARTGRLESYESQEVLTMLAAAADEAGMSFPQRMRP